MRATEHGGPAVHAAATDSRSSPGVGWWWPFRAQLPVRTVAAPEGAFSAQTPPARPFSYPAPTLPRRVPTAYGVSATTRHRHRPHSVTALLHPRVRDVSLALRFRVSASCNLPVGPDGWPRSGVLTWAVSPPFPAVTPLVGPHSWDEAADLTATTGHAGTCWTSAKRLDSEASSSEPRHQTIGRRFPECSG